MKTEVKATGKQAQDSANVNLKRIQLVASIDLAEAKIDQEIEKIEKSHASISERSEKERNPSTAEAVDKFMQDTTQAKRTAIDACKTLKTKK